MIYYTYIADSTVQQGEFVQLGQDTNTVTKHQSGGLALGLCRKLYTGENDIMYSEIYVAGGGGQQAVLNTDWDGTPSRFDIVQSRVEPVQSGGVGWIIPNFPKSSAVAGELVYISIY